MNQDLKDSFNGIKIMIGAPKRTPKEINTKRFFVKTAYPRKAKN